MTRSRPFFAALALGAGTCLSGCLDPSPDEGRGCPEPLVVALPGDDPLRSAPETLLVDERAVFLATTLWRDFMPVAPPDGRELVAVVRLVAADSLAFPVAMDADTLWVIDGEKAWLALLRDEGGTAPEHVLERVARCGPKSGPGISVDVVVSAREGSGERRRLRAAKQPIERTD